LRRTLELLQRAGHNVRALPTTGPGTAAAIAEQCIRDGADLVLAAGGDGTINEVVNGMVYSQVPLGILPGGTANVLAMELGLGTKMERAAAIVSESLPERISVGRLTNEMNPEGRHFLLMTGAGLDAHIVYHISAGWKSALGKVAYWAGGFSMLGKQLPEFEIETQGKTFRVSFALVSRVRNYGGDIEIAQDVSLLDDRFELVLFEGQSAFPYLRYMIGILVRRLNQTPGIHILHATEAELGSAKERVYVQVDGEFAGWLPSRVELVPESLTLLTPPGFRARFAKISAAKEPALLRPWTISPTR